VSELSPAARELLAAAREQLGPDAATVARMRSGIAAAAAKGAATGAGSTALAAKLGLVTIVAGVVIGVAVYATRAAPTVRPSTPHVAPHAVIAPPPVVHVAPREVEAPPPEAPAARSPRELVDERPRAVAPAIVARHEPAAAPDVAEEEPAAPPVDLAREVELIDRAMAALRAGDPRAAIAAVKLHATETRGHGQLAEDAAAIEIEAACRLHDPSVPDKLAAFDERFPTSAQRSRLPTHCK
jgi:hypothetical protein